MPKTTIYQLWCYYERRDNWMMEGFFRTKEEAEKHVMELRDNVRVPCMPDWLIVELQGEW